MKVHVATTCTAIEVEDMDDGILGGWEWDCEGYASKDIGDGILGGWDCEGYASFPQYAATERDAVLDLALAGLRDDYAACMDPDDEPAPLPPHAIVLDPEWQTDPDGNASYRVLCGTTYYGHIVVRVYDL